MGLIVGVSILEIFLYIFRIPLFCYTFYLVFIIIGIYRTNYWLNNESIVLTEKHITYTTSGITIQAYWSDVEEIKKMFIYVFGSRQDCLVIDQSKIKIISTDLRGQFLLPLSAGRNLQQAIIPLSHFAENWRDSDLGQQIKQYAPHLFK
jgi:hypothetical protein